MPEQSEKCEKSIESEDTIKLNNNKQRANYTNEEGVPYELLHEEMDQELLKRKLFPTLIRPNMGQPDFIHPTNVPSDSDVILNMPEFLDFEFEGLLTICDQSSIDEICSDLDNRLFIYPLSEKFNNGIAQRMGKYPVRIKELKKTSVTELDDPTFNYKQPQPQLYLETEHAFPGREWYYFAKFHFKVPSKIFYRTKDSLLKYCPPEASSLREMILCDIVYDLTDETKFDIDSVDGNYIELFTEEKVPHFKARTNYHALGLAIKNSIETSDVKFWHATDLHISKRNDEIPNMVFNAVSANGIHEKHIKETEAAKTRFENILMNQYVPDENIAKINNRLKNKRIYAYIMPDMMEYQDDKTFWSLPIEYRLQMVNNNLRMFIYQANDAYRNNQLDFIIMSGDLIDYVKHRTAPDFEYTNSNWKNFVDILLGKPLKSTNGGLLPPEELLVPVFLIPGNHDYRGHTYPLEYAIEALGLTLDEIMYYPKLSRFQTIRSLYSNIKFLRAYFQFLNPDLNYIRKFGKMHMVFMDTDKDSILDITDLINGSPSTRGLRDSQMKWLKRYCDENVKIDETVIIISHAPPLNPPKLGLIKPILEAIYPEIKEAEELTGENKFSINLLNEHALRHKFEDPRVDPIIDLKFGTILKNWDIMLETLLNCKSQGNDKRIFMVLSGHSHENLEFRIERLEGRELSQTPYLGYLPFYKKDIPCAIYLGNYSEEYVDEIEALQALDFAIKEQRYTSKHLIINHYPFVILTTSLGPRSTNELSRMQGYREIIIKNNRVEGWQFKKIYRHFVPFDIICEKNVTPK
jgi:hypothetical protein